MIVKFKECTPIITEGLGATLAENHMAPIAKKVVEGSIAPGTVVVLDFDGIKAVNGSYIKGTALWLWTCGRLSAETKNAIVTPRHQSDPRPYDIYVILSSLQKEVLTEFREFLEPRNVPMLVGMSIHGDEIENAILIGRTDPTLQFTFKVVAELGPCTAPQLHALFPKLGITVTAWNNRLNDLHSLRLVRRTRAGRGWTYEALAKRILWE